MAERVRRPHPFRSEVRRATAVRTLTVRDATAVAPTCIRIVLGGEELGPFIGVEGTPYPAMISDGFDDVAVLFFPDAEGNIARPHAFADGRLLPDDAQRVLPREYTVRELDVAADRLVVDVMLHDHGVASDWARTAKEGDTLVVVGPRISRGIPTTRLIAVGDASAVPALARLGEMTDQARIIAAVDDAVASLLPASAHRSDHVVDALPSLRADDVFWIAGESGFVTDIRRHLVAEHGIDRRRVQFTGYWRRGASGLLEHQPE